MSGSSQKRALQNYRDRLSRRGMARFEVVGLDADRALIRALARRLAESGVDATTLRTTVTSALSGEPQKRGGVLAALRRSPLVGAELYFAREETPGRKLDL